LLFCRIVKTILVVDGNVALASAIASTLGHYQVNVTHNGPEALERAATLSGCDLLIADFTMPGMAGDRLARRVRDIHPATRTLLLTTYAEYLILSDPAAVDAKLGKPFSPSALRQSVDALIGQP
jgi:CheY-like chemotaxis protein